MGVRTRSGRRGLPCLGPARLPLQVETAHAGLHRALAVGRGPGRAQPAIGARAEAQRTLALLLEHELVVDEPALAAAPFSRLVLVDARPDRVNGIEVATPKILDGEK